MKLRSLICIMMFVCLVKEISIVQATEQLPQPSISDTFDDQMKSFKNHIVTNGADSPFYIITVTNGESNPVNSLNRKFLQLVLEFVINRNQINLKEELSKEIMHMRDAEKKKDEEYQTLLRLDQEDEAQLPAHLIVKRALMRNDICDSTFLQDNLTQDKPWLKDLAIYEKLYNQIIEELSSQIIAPNSPGIVVFQESSFGGELFFEKEAKEISEQFSKISRNMIWALNYSMITDEPKLFRPSEDNIAHALDYPNIFAIRNNNNSPFIKKTSNYEICNRTDFYFQETPIAQYLKNTYFNEAPDLNEHTYNENGFIYKYGCSDIFSVESPHSALTTLLSSLFSWRICFDYQYIDDLQTKFLQDTGESIGLNDYFNSAEPNIGSLAHVNMQDFSGIKDFSIRMHKPIQVLQANSCNSKCHYNRTYQLEKKNNDNFRYFITSSADQQYQWLDDGKHMPIYLNVGPTITQNPLIINPIAVIGYKTSHSCGYTITIYKIDNELKANGEDLNTRQYIRKQQQLTEKSSQIDGKNFTFNGKTLTVSQADEKTKTIELEENCDIDEGAVKVSFSEEKAYAYLPELQYIEKLDNASEKETVVLRIGKQNLPM